MDIAEVYDTVGVAIRLALIGSAIVVAVEDQACGYLATVHEGIRVAIGVIGLAQIHGSIGIAIPASPGFAGIERAVVITVEPGIHRDLAEVKDVVAIAIVEVRFADVGGTVGI